MLCTLLNFILRRNVQSSNLLIAEMGFWRLHFPE